MSSNGKKSSYFVHPAALVETEAIGEGTRVWAFVHILKGAVIGGNCNICDHIFIEQGVRIGNNVTLKCGIYVWEGITIEDDVFLGPNVVFTNDLRPRSKQYKPAVETLIKKGASIGANSTVLAGVTIGEYAMVGIGSVITRDIKPHSLVYGNPAKHRAWIDKEGNKLEKSGDIWISAQTLEKYRETEHGLEQLDN